METMLSATFEIEVEDRETCIETVTQEFEGKISGMEGFLELWEYTRFDLIVTLDYSFMADLRTYEEEGNLESLEEFAESFKKIEGFKSLRIKE